MSLSLYSDLFLNPFNTFDWFDQASHNRSFTCDDQNYYLRYEIPGFAEKDIKLEILKGHLQISGSNEGEGNFKSKSEFSVRYVLPKDIDSESELLKAECKNGVLYVTIPRKVQEKPKPKLIPFKST